MKTAEKINEITDPGFFEQLSNAILRLKFPYLSNLIETGVNAKGKTIRDPVDAFCIVSNNHYALIEYTTNESNLQRKWLHEQDGDLVKAIAVANLIKGKNSNGRFSIFLVTNHHVSSDLLVKVAAVNSFAHIEVNVIEQSTLSHFLDIDAEGQYLRSKFLNIDEDLLSRSLFKKLSIGNLEAYKTESFIHNELLVSDLQLDGVLQSISSTNILLTLLVADSGMGKSTLCYNLMQSYSYRGHYFLRISPSIINEASSLIDAVEKQIRMERAKLFITRDILHEVLNSDCLIIVDDINKVPYSVVVLNKLIGWSSAVGSNFSGLKIVCPIWPRFLEMVANSIQKESFYNIHRISALSYKNGKQIINKGIEHFNLNLSKAEIDSILEQIKDDPLLIGLYIHLIRKNGIYLSNYELEVVKSFIFDQINDISKQTSQSQQKIRHSIENLAWAMLRNKQLSPDYQQIKNWFANETEITSVVDVMAFNRVLFYFDNNGRIQFRHDRVRNYLLAMGMHSKRTDIADQHSIFCDPFYSEMLAATLTFSEIVKEDLDILLAGNPVAVYQSLKYFQSPEKQGSFNTVALAIKAWAAAIQEHPISAAVLHDIVCNLLKFDTKSINELTSNFPDSQALCLAKFRNGDCISGIRFLMYFSDFPPSLDSYWRDAIVDHIKKVHFSSIESNLIRLLQSNIHPKAKPYAYMLGGYLRSTKVVSFIYQNWMNSEKEEGFLFYFWSLLNCFTKENEDIVSEAFVFWEQLPKDHIKQPVPKSLREIVVFQFSNVFWNFDIKQIWVLSNLAVKPGFIQLIRVLFRYIDSPAALKIVVEDLGDQLENSGDNDMVRLMGNEDRWEYDKHGIRLSQESLEFLLNFWRDERNKEFGRKVAYMFWSGNERKETVISVLQQTEIDSEILNSYSLQTRVKLGDRSVFNEYKSQIEIGKQSIGWLVYVWDNSMISLLMAQAGEILKQQDYLRVKTLLRLLCRIDPLDAEKILVEYWQDLKRHKNAIVTALFIATPTTRQLAADEILFLGFDNWEKIKDKYEENWGRFIVSSQTKALSVFERQKVEKLGEEFKYIYMYYGGMDRELKKLLTLEKLNSLIPYLKLLSKHTIRQFADLCHHLNYQNWFDAYLLNILHEEDQEYYKPSDNTILDELERMSKKQTIPNIERYINELSKRKVNNERLIEILKVFANGNHSFDALSDIGEVLKKIGTRKDTVIIENFTVNDAEGYQVTQKKAEIIYFLQRNTLV